MSLLSRLLFLILIFLPGITQAQDEIDRAYQRQKLALFQQLQISPPTGFKAGLTADGAPSRFGLSHPVHGVLTTAPLTPDAAGDLRLSEYRRPMLEMELGFVLARSLERLPESPEALRKAVRSVHPVVEIPDLPAGEMPTGVAVIANNVFARHYLMAPALNSGARLNALVLSLRRDGVQIEEGVAGSVMADQWRALAWLIARTLEQGWELTPGQVLITGAIGGLSPAQEGRHQLLVDGEPVLDFAFRP